MQKVQILAGELKNKTNQLQETRIRVDKVINNEICRQCNEVKL